ncbi:replication protein C, IncQ-type [Bordetella trematum]|uniref:replication protein C, IncQ-type n=1 Tax=Bordetella trematum TaxID=123899 RepID=UPI000D9760DD|nr:replication protein C, IncQ-type [Bordetella trematum]SPU51036.1 Plasmd and phage interon-binding protein [Bordetella trematum]VDH07291.1 Replication protein C (RepC) [Bordetella trematum]
MASNLTHARHDPMHCLAPGLFRSLKRGDRKKLKLDVTYRYGDNECARFIGFEPLGADDMRLLQGLVALAGPNGVILTAAPTGDLPKQLRLGLSPKLDAKDSDGLVVRHHITRLMAEIGWDDSGKNILTVKASLVRMSNVTVIIDSGPRRASFHLMSHAFDAEDGKLFVCLNPQIAEAVLGHRPHSRIDLNEVRRLNTDPARLMHQRLCGWIDPGKQGSVELDTLCAYIWPDAANAEAMKKRRQVTRRALVELHNVGWGVDEYSKGKWMLRRPAKGKTGGGSAYLDRTNVPPSPD